jgi:hypothetical protein
VVDVLLGNTKVCGKDVVDVRWLALANTPCVDVLSSDKLRSCVGDRHLVVMDIFVDLASD